MGGITDSVDTDLSKLSETMKYRETWRVIVHGVQISGHDLVTEQQQHLGHHYFGN